MKVKPTDKKYFCFVCGENGDAIDFVAKYYNRSPREAAMQIADEFGIIYDSSVRSPPKPVRREKSPMQILEETKTKTYRVLSDYLHLLKEWERNFRPESMEKIDERYVEAVQNREKVEFQLATLLWGTEDEKEAVIHDLGKGVEDIERMLMCGKVTHKDLIESSPTIPKIKGKINRFLKTCMVKYDYE